MSHPGPDIRRLFEPRGVAIIGASRDPAKIGFKIVQNMVLAGSPTPVYPVNPKGGEVLGLPIVRDLAAIDGPVDLAVIAIPAPHVMGALEACAARRVPFLAIVTSGFSEVGRVEEEQRLVRYARAHGMRILGPNIFGIFVAKNALNAGFAPADISPGKLAIITQSGAMGGAMIGKTAAEGIGLSALVPLGNKADLDEADLLDYLREDPGTEIILIYIEGVKQGRRLRQALQATTPHKPVIVIKCGRSPRGAQAAASHTGSLAGSDEVFDALMRQCGVLRAEHLEEALIWCKFLGEAPRPRGERAVIVTNGGGAGVAASDACEKYEVPLHDGAPTLEEVFRPFTPPLGSTKNPIDLTGAADAAHYERVLTAGLDEASVHAVIAIYCETAILGFETLPESITRVFARYREAGKPIVFGLLGGKPVARCIETLRARGVPAFGETYTAISCLGALDRYERYRRLPPGDPRPEVLPLARIRQIVRGALADGRRFLLAHEGQAVLQAIGITTPGSRQARTIGEAAAAAEAIGFPVVLKVVSPDILHKSDIGGVALDLEDRDEVIDAYQAIMHHCRARQPEARIDGVEVSAMVPPGTEVIVGARTDPSFGPIVMFGLGGVYVEVLADVSFRAVPLARREASEMIKETRAHRLLLGVRGEEPRDLEAVMATLLKIAALIEGVPEISDIEINPLVVYEEHRGATAVDIRIMLAEQGAGDGAN